MYSEKGVIEKCYYYRSYKDGIVVKRLTEKPTIDLYDGDLKIVWSYQPKSRLSHAPVLFKDKLWLYDRGTGIVLDMNNGKEIVREERLYLHISDEYTASIANTQPDAIQIKFLDGKTTKIPSNQSQLKFYDNTLIEFFYDDSGVMCTDLETGEQLWSKSYNAFLSGKQIKKAGNHVMVDDNFYIYLHDHDDYDNRATVCVDLRTGTTKDMFMRFSGDLTLHDNRIYAINDLEIAILDIATKRVSNHNMQAALSNQALRMSWTHFDVADAKLFFIDVKVRPTNRIGVIDLTSFDLIWDKTFEVSDNINNSITDVKVAGDRLFVYGSDYTLNVLTKK